MTWTGDFAGTRTLDIAPEAIVAGSMFADRYAIENRLGSGAQSTVYAALDMQAAPPRRVALKIARSNAFDETNLAREAEFLARIHQQGNIDGVVRLLENDVQEFGGVKYLVLEHIDGPTLRNKTLLLSEVCRMGSAIAQTLAKIHEIDIVLADVKPDNIVLRQGIEPVLVDFGAARNLHDANAPPLLTPAYASPEQRADQAPTCASDVYALGVVLEEVAGSQSSKAFVSTITQCKWADPTKRPTALAFSRALESASTGQTRKQSRQRVVGIVALIVGLAGLITILMLQHHEKTDAPSVRMTKPALTMISAPGNMLYLALGDTHLYWSDGDGRAVFRAPLAGGSAEMVTQLETPAHQLAVSGQTLFVRSPGDIWSYANAKWERFAEATGRGGMTADARNVVWTNEESGDVVMGGVRHDVPLRVLAAGQPRPYAVTMDETHVYWANEANGTLARVPRAGGAIEVLARGQLWPAGTALDKTHLYWVDRTAGFLMRVPKSGGELQIITKVSVGSRSTALEGTHLYWTSTEDGRVMRVPKTGGSVEVLARGQPHPFDIVVRGNDVFFSNDLRNGGVMRLILP